ncbi:MAG: hypothetical protein JNK67_09330 [Alphaproteobacteria bacterium]|nr:hypothetical protein [Alphaproteobacteria bacterium]
MSVARTNAGPTSKRVALLWRLHGACLLGGGLFVSVPTIWFLIGIAADHGLFDRGIVPIYALLGPLAFLGLALSVEGSWRIVCARPSLWGVRMLGFGLIGLTVVLVILCIHEGVNPLTDG